VAGRDVLELGCGGAQWSIQLAGQGARPVALDNSGRQLAHARRLMGEAGVRFPLVHASAEVVPLADASFDIVFCDHGGMSFADPALTVPEAARLLRPGGLLAFNMSTPFLFLTWDPATETVGERLLIDYFGLRRFAYDDGLVEYQLPYGEWIRLFRMNGFVIENLTELRPPEDATTTYPEFAPLSWARRWPAEHVWRVRKEG
jgi:SAM-dependent methyltransferase